jgi:hypothetical protein
VNVGVPALEVQIAASVIKKIQRVFVLDLLRTYQAETSEAFVRVVLLYRISDRWYIRERAACIVSLYSICQSK